MSAAPHPTAFSDEQLLSTCALERLRRSGPGGQRRNKVATGVRLKHLESGLVAEAFESRSAETNLRTACDRLRRLLAVSVRRPVEDGSSLLWSARCRHGRVVVSPQHADVPALLAECLDHLAAADWRLAVAADRLGTTPSQLVKLLSLETRALQLVNAHRAALGLSPLQP